MRCECYHTAFVNAEICILFWYPRTPSHIAVGSVDPNLRVSDRYMRLYGSKSTLRIHSILRTPPKALIQHLLEYHDCKYEYWQFYALK